MAGAMRVDVAGDNEWARVGIAGKVALVFAGSFIAIGLFAIGPVLPVLQARFAAEPNAVLLAQLVGGIAPPVFALASPLAGRLVSRLGVRTTYLLSLLAFLVGGVGPATCSSLIAIVLCRVVLGVGVAGTFTAAMSGIARLPERQRHLLYGFAAFVGGGICIPAFPLVGTLANSNWRLAFLVALILLPAGLFALALPRHRAVPRAAAVHGAAAVRRPLGGVPPQLLVLALIDGWATMGSSLYAPFLLASFGTTDPAAVGQLLGVTSLCSLGGSGTYGFAQTLLGTRGMVLAAAGVAAAGCLLIAASATLLPVTVGLGLLSAGVGIFGAAGYAAAVEAAGPHGDTGAATGVVSLGIYLPQVLFPMLAAAVAGRFGSPAVYLLLAVLLVAGLLLFATRRSVPRAVAAGTA